MSTRSNNNNNNISLKRNGPSLFIFPAPPGSIEKYFPGDILVTREIQHLQSLYK